MVGTWSPGKNRITMCQGKASKERVKVQGREKGGNLGVRPGH